MSCDQCYHSYGFGLEECRERDFAEEVTKKSLAMASKNAFATHALSKYSIFDQKFMLCYKNLVLLEVTSFLSNPITNNYCLLFLLCE